MSRETSEEIEHLKDQVHRLSESLTNFQSRRQHPHPPTRQTRHQSLPTTAFESFHGYNEALSRSADNNKGHLTPLLSEYDKRMAELTQQISLYQAELESMTQRVEEVTEENAHLHLELRKNLEAQIQAAGSKSGMRADVGDMLNTLQQQLDRVTKDRDACQELLKKTCRELDACQRRDQEKASQLLHCKAEVAEAKQAVMVTKRGTEDLELNHQKMDEERVRCLKIIRAQELELEEVQEKFNQVKGNLRTASTKNEELTTQLEEASYQLKKKESDRVRAMSEEKTLDERVHLLQIANTDLEGKLLTAQREAIALSGEKTSLEETLTALQSRIAAMEQREQEAVTHVRESMQIAEGALLEKEQACVREKQLEKQVEILRASVSTVVKEAGERTEREITLLRGECNKSIDKMGAEIHRLEQEVGERQAQLERCQREKKMVEKELEKVHAQKPLELIQAGENIHELQKRVCVAERARDDALVKLEASEAANKRMGKNLSEEKQANSQLDEEHRKWQRKVQEETQKLRDEKLRALSESSTLQQQLRISEQAKEAAEVKLVQEVTALEKKCELKEKELNCRIQSSEEAHQKSIFELRGLLKAQHRVGAKWREESKVLTETSEKTISNLSNELIRCRMRIDELTKQLSHLKSVKEDLGKRLKTATESKENLQQRLQDAEGQAEGARTQVAEMVTQAKGLLEERRELNRQLDQARLQMTRTTSYKRNYHNAAPGVHPKAPPTPPPTMPRPHRHHLPYLSSMFPSATPPTHTQPLTPTHDPAHWNQNLSKLQQSLRQVREGLGLEEMQTTREESGHCSPLSMTDLSQPE